MKKKTKTKGSVKVKLTAKQILFCDEYLIKFNATKAAIKAGYSKKTAEQQGYRLLTKVQIQIYIKKRMDARSERTQITQDMVLKRWAQIGFANIKDFIVWDVNGIVRMKSSEELTHDQTAAILEVIQVSSDKGNTFRFKMKDDQKATDSIAKHLGMFIEKIEHTGKDGAPLGLTDVERTARITAILERARKSRD